LPTGRIFRYERDKGYGFITPDEGGPDVFLHVSQLMAGEDPNRLQKGAGVAYRVQQDAKGLKATHVRFAEPLEDDELCDVLTVTEFDQAIGDMFGRLRQELTELAKMHGWVA
jgi:cold shock protein